VVVTLLLRVQWVPCTILEMKGQYMNNTKEKKKYHNLYLSDYTWAKAPLCARDLFDRKLIDNASVSKAVEYFFGNYPV
jgi:hypothetical protein